MVQLLPGQIGSSFGSTENAAQGSYVGAPSAGLKGTMSGNVMAVSPEAGYGAGLASSVNGYHPSLPYTPAHAVLGNSVAPSPVPTPAPAPSSGGGNSGGGGSSYNQQWSALGRAGTPPVGWHGEGNSNSPTMPNIDQAAIDAQYNPQMDYLNSAEQNVRTDQPNVLAAAQGNYDVNKAQLDTGNTTAMNQFGQQTDQATQRNLDATDASQRLYQDLNRGYQQRFGGASSAGQAASEIANVEQQRQSGMLARGYADTQRTIEQQRQGVQASYQNNLLQLNQQKQVAIDQANRDFQNKLLDIQKSRADVQGAKASANLQALMNLRSQVFAINQQNTQFQQTLAAQTNQAHLQLQNYQAMVGAGQGATAQAMAGYNTMASTNPQTGLGVNGGGSYGGQQQPSYVGAITNQGGIRYDQNGNPIY